MRLIYSVILIILIYSCHNSKEIKFLYYEDNLSQDSTRMVETFLLSNYPKDKTKLDSILIQFTKDRATRILANNLLIEQYYIGFFPDNDCTKRMYSKKRMYSIYDPECGCGNDELFSLKYYKVTENDCCYWYERNSIADTIFFKPISNLIPKQ